MVEFNLTSTTSVGNEFSLDYFYLHRNQNKNYRTEISNKELLNGYYLKSKQIQNLSEKTYMVKSGTNINLTRDECKQYTSKLE
ncbi:hypothetical protein BpHYR1_040169 [Brachionus plicatilis]|uniref:Uncharacterized protein n=1 Tax=Brachionus plicatilis TaxID=10195 RepID=A0A3M7QRH4_BRAPC|nr:hypothetical protein BpHYR1_040169 [Brachionus plicatilis]